MASLSDNSHIERCSGLRCRSMDLRANMIRKPAPGRGWYCKKCWPFYEKLSKTPDKRV